MSIGSDEMNILYIASENTANVPYTLFYGMNKYTDNKANFVLLLDNFLKYPLDGAQFGSSLTSSEFIDMIKKSDIIHMDDLRNVTHDKIIYGKFKDGLDVDILSLIGNHQKLFWHQNGTFFRKNCQAINNIALRHNINLLASTPDLLKYSKIMKWCPCPIDLERKIFNEPPPVINSLKILCSHAPSKRPIKSTDQFLKFASMRNKIVPKIIERKSNEECLNIRKDCPLHYDQIILGAYGVSAIEGAAMGQIVMVNLRNVKQYVPGNPFIDIPYMTNGFLRAFDISIRILSSNQSRQKHIIQGKQWVKKVHGAQSVVNSLSNMYNTGKNYKR